MEVPTEVEAKGRRLSYVDVLMREPRGRGRITTTHFVPGDHVFSSYEEVQSLYRDVETGWLIPNTIVDQDGTLVMRVNALGCKGDDIDPGLPVVAFFGASETMGVTGGKGGVPADSYVAHVDLPGYAVLNAAIEGANLAGIVGQYERLVGRVPLVCAVVYGGWHNLIYNETDEDYWAAQLARFLDGDHLTVYCTIGSSLTEDFLTRGFEPLRNEAPGADLNSDYFNFWGALDPAETIPRLLPQLERYNTFVRRFAAEHGAHILDFSSFLRPSTYEDAPRDFFDVCHLRPRAYAKVAAYAASVLADILPEPPAVVPAADAVDEDVAEREDMRKNIYPLW